MSEWTTDTPTVSNYERLHGVPERVDEATLWTREGFVDAGWFEKVATSIRKHNARDIGRFAMAGLLATPSSYKALLDVNPLQQPVYHLADTMDIFYKELARTDDGVVKAVRPGITPEQFIDAGGSPYQLRNPDLWVVANDSLHEHFAGGALADDLARLSRGEATGRARLELFGDDELDVLRWSTSMLYYAPRR